MKVLVIGGVAAGTKAAAKLKRERRDYDVTIITESKKYLTQDAGFPIMWGI